ncbi:hypothetical protein GCM10010505_25990 [Kitasatospora aburaviensis]
MGWAGSSAKQLAAVTTHDGSTSTPLHERPRSPTDKRAVNANDASPGTAPGTAPAGAAPGPETMAPTAAVASRPAVHGRRARILDKGIT